MYLHFGPTDYVQRDTLTARLIANGLLYPGLLAGEELLCLAGRQHSKHVRYRIRHDHRLRLRQMHECIASL